ncbi:TonB-dependent receptor [Parabacteroides sp. AF14-59]|uniref:TonB-dependent receptor n=1 Tax=Parabacteroides sp. AF14-59 TaxID=2292240 RepID=UPI000F00F05B|nr:TonB-dependent receptor [Parabacteroides sp. AF14-59]RHR97957.1 SusC/RagA family TonB-linked outer membrane protein [Parabacteroides sp. AF14-59]
MKKNEEFSRKPAHFLKSACLALCLVSYGGSVVYAESTYAEQTTLTVRMNNRTVKDVFSYIEKNSEFIFVYHGSNINLNRKVNVDVNNQTVESILKKMFEGTDIEYIINDRQIIVRKNETNRKQVAVAAPQQEKKISVTGNVKDAIGEPLIGVNVMVKGTTIGGITDANGNFSLSDVAPNAVVSISYIGYKTQEIALNGKTSVNVTLSEDSEALDEVVVIGYGTQKKADLSGAVATVPKKVLENRPVLTVGQALQGSVANLTVSIGSGQATDSPSFNIRGTTSINGGNPLVVIDGVVSSAEELNRMNPTDIGSISVLKDAASAAIYGSRAAFGVILVTTKTAGQEKLTINYNNNFAMRKLTGMADVITDPYLVASTRNTMSYPWYNLYNEEQLAYAKKVSEDPSTSPYFLNPDGTYAYFGSTDWFDEAYKNLAFSTNHTVDVSGKTDRINYYFSANYNFQDGMVKYGTDKYNRYNLRSKLDFKLTDWWTLGNNTSFVNSDYDSPNYLGNSYYWEVNRINPLDVTYNPDGSWTKAGSSVFGRLVDGGRWNQQKTTFSTQFTTKIDIIKDILFVNGSFNYSTNKNAEEGYSLPVDYYDGPDRPAAQQDPVSQAYLNHTNARTLTFDAYATFHKLFNDKHDFTAMIGFNQEDWRDNYTSASRKELISSSLPSLGLASGDMNVGQRIYSLSMRSVFGRLNYIYNNKYIVAFNGRYDGTSRFPHDDRYAFNPSGSVAWVLSEENFFEPVRDVVNFLKFRFSYGSLGNQDLKENYYAYLATMGSGKISNILDGKQPIGVSAPGLVAGNLTWEKVTTADWGMDVNFLNNRLTATVDGYIRRTKDMLTAGAELPNVLGTSEPLENAADLKTTGWDLTISWRDNVKLAGKTLNYGLSFNIGDSRSWITKFSNDTGSLDSYYEGWEMGSIWGLETEGFFTSQEDIDNHADQTQVASYIGTRPLAPGDLKFKDLNEDGKIDKGAWTIDDHGDYKIIGNNRARYGFGFNMNADWNGFDLSLFVQGVLKKNYSPSGDLYFWGIYAQPWTNITYGNYYDRWTEENPSQDAYFPRFKSYVAEGGSEAALTQTRYLQNATYARLKNLTFGYTLPRKWTDKANIQRLRLFFSGDNLCEITGLYKYYKLGPECLGGQMYPLQRSYSFGLNVTF